jgi:hexosaminidase
MSLEISIFETFPRKFTAILNNESNLIMRKILFSIFLFLSTALFANDLGIVPRPQMITRIEGIHSISQNTMITWSDPRDATLGEFLNDFLDEFYGFRLKVESVSNLSKNGIHFLRDDSFKEEAYTLTVTADEIVIRGSHAGLFYGLQTLTQIMPPYENNTISVPCLEIEDAPKFGYRGIMLDVGRYFYSVDEIKRLLDLMAYYKLNVFHWHLTESDGWRMEVKKYPLLTKIGAWSMGTWTKPSRSANIPHTFDKLPHGGYYTRRQMKEVVEYARERHITIIPEIDTPGHSGAALEAYPHLGCDPERNTSVLCLGKESTYTFVKDVIDEVIKLFPSEIIHIGGDEANKSHWKECPDCQQLMAREGLKDVDELQSYYIRQMASYIESKGKRMMGWDEIMEGGELTPRSIVMSWQGEEGGIIASGKNHQVVMSPRDFLYLDYFQGPQEFEPVGFAKYLPLHKVYSYEPLAKIPVENQQNIMGIQANIWTQCIHGQSKLDYMTFPRLLAVAEVGWSDTEKNYPEFYQRMGNNLVWLTKMGVNYRVPEPLGLEDLKADEKEVKVTLFPAIKGSEIYYSTDGEENLLKKGKRYESPIRVDLSETDSVMLKCVIRTPEGKLSGIRVATIKKQNK